MPVIDNKENHPIYIHASTFISKRIPPEHLEALQKEKNTILEKGVILYDAAKEAKVTLTQIRQKEKDRKLWSEVDQKGGKEAFDKDSLMYKFLDVAEYARYAYQKYETQYGGAFAAAITSAATDVIVRTFKTLEKKAVRFDDEIKGEERRDDPSNSKPPSKKARKAIAEPLSPTAVNNKGIDSK